MRALLLSSQPFAEMLLVLSHLLQRPISLLRCICPETEPQVISLTTSTLCVNPEFAAWDPGSVNEDHILLIYHSQHYNAMPLIEVGEATTSSSMFTYTTATAFASADLVEAAGSGMVLGNYRLRDQEAQPSVVTVCATHLCRDTLHESACSCCDSQDNSSEF